jgi:hypothetical protein
MSAVAHADERRASGSLASMIKKNHLLLGRNCTRHSSTQSVFAQAQQHSIMFVQSQVTDTWKSEPSQQHQLKSSSWANTKSFHSCHFVLRCTTDQDSTCRSTWIRFHATTAVV